MQAHPGPVVACEATRRAFGPLQMPARLHSTECSRRKAQLTRLLSCKETILGVSLRDGHACSVLRILQCGV